MSHVGRPVPSEVPKWGLIVSTILLVLFGSACYHYRAIPQRPASDTAVGGAQGLGTEPEGEIVWALAWGFGNTDPPSPLSPLPSPRGRAGCGETYECSFSQVAGVTAPARRRSSSSHDTSGARVRSAAAA